LGTLLRGFGLTPLEIVGQEPKAAMVTLKTEFLRQAKEIHPDVVKDDEKADAQAKFISLHRNYEEAAKLLGSGVRPLEPTAGWSSQGAAAHMRFAHRRDYDHDQHYTPPPSEPEFDTATKLKGRLVVGSVFVFFYYFMVEFLANSAGSTLKWHPGNGVRRYATVEEISEEKKKETEAKKEKAKEKAKERENEKRDRGLDSFYTKRGIRNEKRVYAPRGCGPSI